MSQGWTNVVSSTTIKDPRIKKRKKFVTMYVSMLEGIIEIWLEIFSLDLDYCKRGLTMFDIILE